MTVLLLGLDRRWCYHCLQGRGEHVSGVLCQGPRQHSISGEVLGSPDLQSLLRTDGGLQIPRR